MKRPLLIVTITYIIGIIMGVYFKLSILFVFTGIIILILCTILLKNTKIIKSTSNDTKLIKNKKILKVIVIVIITIFISYIRVQHINKKYEEMYLLDEKEISVSGTICDQIKQTDYKYAVTVRLKKNIKLIVYFDKKIDVKNLEYGNQISFTGTYNSPDGARNYKGYNYKRYLKTKGIYGTVNAEEDIKITKTRNLNLINILINNLSVQFKENLEKLLHTEEAQLAKGILLGDSTNIDEQIKLNFRKCNLSHMLAVSGTHLAYLILGINTILNKKIFGIRKTKAMCIILIVIFMIIVNMSPSVVRAGISAIIAISATLVFRKQDTYTTISFALLLTLINNPFSIFDTGLQLSYLATLSIIIFYPKMRKTSNEKNKIIKYISNSAKLTISANILILPVIIYNFNNIPINSILSNLVTGSIFAGTIILGFLTLIISLICFPFARILAIPLNLLLKLLIVITNTISKIPFGNYTIITPHFIYVIMFYMLILSYLINKNYKYQEKINDIINIYTDNKKTKRKFNKNNMIIFIMILLIVSQGLHSFNLNKELKIYFIDVGQGDSCLLCTPKGKKILIDGGGSLDSEKFDVGEKTLLPYLLDRRVKTLDYVIISHFDTDHYGSIKYLLQEIKIKQIIIGKQFEISENYKEFLEIVRQKKIKVNVVEAGKRIEIEKNFYFDVLWPNTENIISQNSINNNSLVCKIIYNDFSMLFTGDIEEIAERAILEKYKNNKDMLKSTVLKVAHHGSKSSSTVEFLKTVKAKIAVIGVGKNNKFGHPNSEVIDRLNIINDKIYRTDLDGEIEICVNSKGKIKVKKMID